MENGISPEVWALVKKHGLVIGPTPDGRWAVASEWDFTAAWVTIIADDPEDAIRQAAVASEKDAAEREAAKL